MTCETKDYVESNFDMKEMGKATFVIGIKIFRDRSRGLLELSQETSINAILKRFHIEWCRPLDAPIIKGDKFSKDQCPRNEIEMTQMEKCPYEAAIGNLMYAHTYTRLNISCAVRMLSRYQSEPSIVH